MRNNYQPSSYVYLCFFSFYPLDTRNKNSYQTYGFRPNLDACCHNTRRRVGFGEAWITRCGGDWSR